MYDAVITTGRKCQKESIRLAEVTALKLNIKYIERKNISIENIAKNYNVTNVLVAKKNSLRLMVCKDTVNEVFFHPSLSHLRIKNLLGGGNDHLIEAMKLNYGMKVLDCTLGLGSDAIVESFITGSAGNVTAIEINPYIAEVVAYGLQNFIGEREELTQAMRRIKVINADYMDILKSAANDEFDIVYFDPMFRHALKRSSSLNPMRNAANHSAVTLEAVKEACRIAKYRVVLKENAKSFEFNRLGFTKIYGGKYSPIHYGVIDCLK